MFQHETIKERQQEFPVILRQFCFSESPILHSAKPQNIGPSSKVPVPTQGHCETILRTDLIIVRAITSTGKTALILEKILFFLFKNLPSSYEGLKAAYSEN